jgi:hypothetical protein
MALAQHWRPAGVKGHTQGHRARFPTQVPPKPETDLSHRVSLQPCGQPSKEVSPLLIQNF